MKGSWHVVALSVSIAILYIFTQRYMFLLALIGWLVYLVLSKRLRKFPFFISLTFSLFFLAYIPHVNDLSTPTFTSDRVHITGKVIEPLTKTDRKVNFLIRDAATDQKILVVFFPTTETRKQSLIEQQPFHRVQYGSTCIIQGKIETPPSSRNPGQFNYRKFLAEQGVTKQLIIESLADVRCEGSSPFLHRFYSIRQSIQSFVQNSYSEETAAWIQALVLGETSQLSDETIDLFQRWGLSHLLAISGLHVGLIVGLLYFIFIKSGILTKERARWLLIVFLPVYALLAGGKPSVWRASMMALFLFIFSKINLRLSITDILSIVFLSLLLANRYIVYQIGFQFSFLVTFGLILSRRWVEKTDSLFFQVLIISFVSQMMIVPLQFNYFYTFNPLSIVLNTIVVPYFSLLVIPLMFVLTLIASLPILPTALDTFFSHIHELFMTVVKQVDHLFYEPWIFGSFPLGGSLVFYTLFMLFMIYIYKQRLIAAFSYGCLLTLMIMAVMLQPYFSPNGSVTMLDIGQGDAFILELPERKGVFFFDAGAQFSFKDFEATDHVYQHILKPYLHFKGIRDIDAIFISHEDLDHSGSVGDLVKEMNVKTIVISDYYELSDATLRQWEKHGVTIQRVKQQDEIAINGQVFTIVSPMEDRGSPNENSLVVHTHIGGKNWLFTGDIGKETERQIMNTYTHLSVDILKVGHHGSNTSTDADFIQSIQPSYAFISVGENNMYGHPTPEVIQTLEDANVHVLRTDQDGAVIFRYEGDIGTFYKFLP